MIIYISLKFDKADTSTLNNTENSDQMDMIFNYIKTPPH